MTRISAFSDGFAALLMLALSALLMVSGCSKPLDTEDMDAMQGKTLYLACNLFPDIERNNALSSVNYHIPGGMLKWATPIEITDIDRKHLVFKVIDTGIEYPYSFHGRTIEAVSPEEHLARIFVADIEPLKQEVSAMSEIDRRGIEEGVAHPGMTKRAVLIAIGYPPEFATPDPMAANEWNYWYDRFREFVVAFGEDGKVITITGYYPEEESIE